MNVGDEFNGRAVVNVYPEDLNTRSYVSFDFYGPDFARQIIDAIEGLFQAGVQLFTSKGDASATLSAVGDNVKSAADVITNTFSKRFSITADGKLKGDVSSGDVIKDGSSWMGSIYLPLTNAVNENISNRYTEETGVVASLIDTVFGDSVANKALSNVARFTGTRAVLINPDVVQSYRGTGLRSIGFTWNLMAKNSKEAKQIMNIIKLFKTYSAPELKTANALLLAPPFCKITFTNEKMQDSMRYKEMMIDSVQVDYGSSGSFETFKDGVPKEITLTVRFVERRMMTIKDWDGGKKQKYGDPIKSPEFGTTNSDVGF